jgi:hypothetical protein
VVEEWRRRVAAEYGSAGITAQVLTWGIQAGLPAPLLHTAARIVRDELDHAELSHGVVQALGGDGTAVDLATEDLAFTADDGLLGNLARTVARSFCIGETLAVPYFAEMRRRAGHPAVLAALDRILADEAAHRAFGWDALDAILGIDPAVAPWLSERLPRLKGTFAGYAAPPDAPALTEDERACGLLEHAEYAALFARTWAEDVAPRFARRGIA